MSRLFVLAIVALLLWSSMSVSAHMNERPVAIKLGFVPPVDALKMLPREHHATMGASLSLKVLFYFGSLVEEWKNQVMLQPEYQQMFHTLETATQLDPYNADPYYFANAIFTWDAGRVQEVNQLLVYGMDFRTWDAMLPFFAGFNEAYFLKNYEKASRYMAQAAEKSGNAGMARLASRYFYEAGELTLAIEFLSQMEHLAPSAGEAELYRLRKEALHAVAMIQQALADYRARFGQIPESLDELVRDGQLSQLPIDPYGGQFFVDSEGQVRSTSKFALPRPTKKN